MKKTLDQFNSNLLNLSAIDVLIISELGDVDVDIQSISYVLGYSSSLPVII